MPVILLTNNYSQGPLNILKKEIPPGFELMSLGKACKKELLKKSGLADYFLASGRITIDKEVIYSASRLKMIQRTGVGIDTLDLGVLKEKGIPVYVNQGVNSRSVAEHTLMLILSVLRQLPLIDSSVRGGNWLKQELGVECSQLYNKKVGLVGLGNIGTEVAMMLQPFGVKVLYYKPSRSAGHTEKDLKVHYRDLPGLLQESDIVSLHCPLDRHTEGMIGRKEIALMKPGSFLVNTSRGALVDHWALIKNLESGHLRGAGLDVFPREPLPEDSPILRLNNVVLTPHTGGITRETFAGMMREAMQNIRLFEEGDLPSIEKKRLKV